MIKFFGRFSKVDWVTFVSCVALVVLTLVPLFWDVPSTGGWLRAALISLGALTLSTIVLAQIYQRETDKTVVGEIEELKSLVESAIARDAVHEVPAGQIRDVLSQMLDSSTEWFFRGGSARWQREAVLPALAEVKDRPVHYKIQIISPFESVLCDKYASYRRKSRPDDDRANSKQIRFELLAYIYAAVVWASRSKISPQITLLHRFSPFRLDGNSQSFVITVADPRRNGLRTSEGNWYHASLLDEFEFEAGSATPLNLPSEAWDADGVEDVRRFFDELRELNPEALKTWDHAYSDEDWGMIYGLAGTTKG